MANLLVLVEWDTDGEPLEDCALPENVLILDTPEDIGSDEEEQIAELLSESFGFCHTTWSWERFNHQTHAGGGFFPPNLGVCTYHNYVGKKDVSG